jgi:hypothetical protein
MFAGRSITELTVVALLSLAIGLASAALVLVLLFGVAHVFPLGDLGILLMLTAPVAAALTVFILTFKAVLTITK